VCVCVCVCVCVWWCFHWPHGDTHAVLLGCLTTYVSCFHMFADVWMAYLGLFCLVAVDAAVKTKGFLVYEPLTLTGPDTTCCKTFSPFLLHLLYFYLLFPVSWLHDDKYDSYIHVHGFDLFLMWLFGSETSSSSTQLQNRMNHLAFCLVKLLELIFERIKILKNSFWSRGIYNRPSALHTHTEKHLANLQLHLDFLKIVLHSQTITLFAWAVDHIFLW